MRSSKSRVSGTATSKLIALPGTLTQASLTFKYFLETEGLPQSYDKALVQIRWSDISGTHVDTIAANATLPGQSLPVLRDSGDPLEAGDVPAGAMVALTCTGNAFLLTSGRALEKRPCPPGFVPVTEGFCIEQVQRDTVDFPEAAVICGDLNARLCTWGEWYVACTQATALGNENIDSVFEATVQATEEAIVNAMVAARDMRGEDGHYAKALPHGALTALLRKYNRYSGKR